MCTVSTVNFACFSGLLYCGFEFVSLFFRLLQDFGIVAVSVAFHHVI